MKRIVFQLIWALTQAPNFIAGWLMSILLLATRAVRHDRFTGPYWILRKRSGGWLTWGRFAKRGSRLWISSFRFGFAMVLDPSADHRLIQHEAIHCRQSADDGVLGALIAAPLLAVEPTAAAIIFSLSPLYLAGGYIQSILRGDREPRYDAERELAAYAITDQWCAGKTWLEIKRPHIDTSLP